MGTHPGGSEIMNLLDEELRKALRRADPPEGFAERLFARTAATKQRAWAGVWGRRGLRWALAAAICVVLTVAGLEYRHAREERARGEAAKKELMLALRIAGNKLQLAQAKVRLLGSP
jgi:anti-sigma-K factor RskA